MASCTAFHHRLISLFHINARQIGQNGISEHWDGVVANHAVVLLSPEVPDRQITVGLMMKHHVAHKLGCHIGCNERIERMCSAEGIPQTEGTVIDLSLWHLLDFVVGGHVAAVRITHGIGLHEHMVESCVENGLLLVRTLNVNACQFFLPGIMCRLYIVAEVPAGGFRLHVEACAFAINR